MPQTFLALRCYSCETFQVVQKSQQQRFTCKLCQSKQSIVRVYACGAAKDCRAIVQQLNMARAEAPPPAAYENAYDEPAAYDGSNAYEAAYDGWNEYDQPAAAAYSAQPVQTGRWEQFLAPPPAEAWHEEDDGDDDPRFVTRVDDRKGKRKRQAAPTQQHNENVGDNARRARGGEGGSGCGGGPTRGPTSMAAEGQRGGGHAANDDGWGGPFGFGETHGQQQQQQRHAAPSRRFGPAPRGPAPRAAARHDEGAEDGFILGGMDAAVEEETWD